MRLAAVLLLAVSLAGCFRLSVPETHYQRRVFVNALRADPDLAHAHWMLGRRAMLDGEYREAIGHFRRAVAAQPDFREAHVALGRCWLNLGKPDRALGPLEAALTLSPGSARALELHGQALMELGRLSEARQSFERALAADPAAFLPRAKLGEMAYAAGDFATAIEHWRLATGTDQTDPAWSAAQDDLLSLLRDVERYHALYPDPR